MADDFDKIPFPETPTYPEAIYMIEPTDYALGYNQETNVDGIANQQAYELGCRTNWLKDTFLKQHLSTGAHELRNANFSENVPEKYLNLYKGTTTLRSEFRVNQVEADSIYATIQDMDQATLSVATSVKKIIPLAEEFSYYNNAYELFSPSFSLMDIFNEISLLAPTNVPVAECEQDDTIDLDTLEDIKAGETYVIYDDATTTTVHGGRPELVVVKSLLSSADTSRLRIVTDSVYTRRTGYFARTSLVIENGEAIAKDSTWYYLSNSISVLENDEQGGSLYVCRNAPTNGTVTPSAKYKLSDKTTYEQCQLVWTKTKVDGTVIDKFALPGGKLQLMLNYTGTAYDYKVNYVVVAPVYDILHLDIIRRPVINKAELYNYNTVKLYVERENVFGYVSGFQTMYNSNFSKATVRLMNSKYIDTSDKYITKDYTVYTDFYDITVPNDMLEETNLHVQICFYDDENNVSRWSIAKPVTARVV